MKSFSVEWQNNDKGEIAIIPLKNAPYPHESRKDGYKIKDKVFSAEVNYSDSSTGFIIPADYQMKKKVSFIIHFHGHQCNVQKEITDFKFDEILKNSGKNVILILPQGPKDAIDSGCGKLEDEGGFERFMLEVLETLKSEKKILPDAKIDTVILSTHSGGYKVTGQILLHGGMKDKIREVYLFDSTYGQLENFTNWASDSRKHKLYSIFTDHLAGENIELMSLLQKNDEDDFLIRMDKDITDELLEDNKIIFHHTECGHMEVMNNIDLMLRLIKASCLKDIK